MKSKVYFTSHISPSAVKQLYEMLDSPLQGRIAVKIHSGEKGNQNFIEPSFWKEIYGCVGGTMVETNTAYNGARRETARHLQLLEEHGWSPTYPVEILDGAEPDLELSIPRGKRIRKNYVGAGIAHYDSMLVLSHFKGHPMGGFGGAIKQLAIGMASSYGKQYIHGVGKVEDFWNSDHDSFLEAMADAASSVVRYFEGRIAYVSVMKNMSVDCDCCAVAEDPCMGDLGILASLDPVAIDQAALDLVYASRDPGRDHFLERVESRNGLLTVLAAEALGIGSRDYERISLD